jgi:hypothetical protein
MSKFIYKCPKCGSGTTGGLKVSPWSNNPFYTLYECWCGCNIEVDRKTREITSIQNKDGEVERWR